MIEAEDPDSQDDRQTRDIVQYQEYHLSLAGLRPISKFTKHSFTNHPDVVPTRQIHISKESQKMAVVMISNAVVHPWTLSFSECFHSEEKQAVRLVLFFFSV